MRAESAEERGETPERLGLVRDVVEEARGDFVHPLAVANLGVVQRVRGQRRGESLRLRGLPRGTIGGGGLGFGSVVEVELGLGGALGSPVRSEGAAPERGSRDVGADDGGSLGVRAEVFGGVREGFGEWGFAGRLVGGGTRGCGGGGAAFAREEALELVASRAERPVGVATRAPALLLLHRGVPGLAQAEEQRPHLRAKGGVHAAARGATQDRVQAVAHATVAVRRGAPLPLA